MSYIQLALISILTFVITVCTYAQDTVVVPLFNVVTDSSAFGKRHVNTLLTRSAIQIKNMPSDVVDFRIKKRPLGASLPDLYVFHGIRSDGKRIIIFDSNFDNDLIDERNYVFDRDNSCQKETARRVIDSISPVEIRYPGCQSFFFKPVIYNCVYKYNNTEDSLWHLELVVSYYRKGEFQVEKRPFTVITNVRDRFPQFYVNSTDSPIPTDPNETPPHTINESIFLDAEQFTVHKVSEHFDTAWIIYQKRSDSSFGSQAGLFAKDIRSVTLDGQPFSLASLKGSYVLLDFWGSWCIPCIQLIPDLVDINKKYSGKLKLVSVACDRMENLKMLNKIIQEKQMNWTHLFADQTEANSLNEQYNIAAYPTSILIDPKGKIIKRSAGVDNFNDLRKIIDDSIN